MSDESNDEEDAILPGTSFGDYVLEEELGRGGFGVVYRARQVSTDRVFALKRMRGGEVATDGEIRRFLQGAEAAAILGHPNIVRVHEAGQHGRVPFFTMAHIKGQNLAEVLAHREPTQEQATRWLAQIAHAVHHAHERGLIHRDLKPANILLDEHDVPYVTDFGLARRIDGAGSSSHSHAAGGAPHYMAPEQLLDDPSQLTVRTDVYGLGAILYQLLTGEFPYGKLSYVEWVQALLSAEPVTRPRNLAPELSRDLEKICLRALAKRSEDRYPTALALAQDLERVRSGAPIDLGSSTSRARIRAWFRRHPRARGMLVGGLLLVFGFVFWLDGVSRVEQQALVRQEQENAAMASVQAVAFRFQLLEYAHRVARLAQQQEVIALLRSPVIENPSRVLIERGRGFDTMFVLGPDGRQRARTSRMPEEYMGRSFAFRDYFRGARQLALEECDPRPEAVRARAQREPRAAYLARSHLSESDGQFEFAISAPICDAQGWIGSIGGTIASNKVFGSVRLADGHPGRIAALLGPRDADRKDVGRPLPNGFTFIVHPGLVPGREFQLHRPSPAKIRFELGIPAPSGDLRYVAPLRVPDYLDPIPGYQGLWSAAIAPVDASGFVVVVQSPREHEGSLPERFAQVPLWRVIPFAVGLALLVTSGVLRSSRRATLLKRSSERR